MPNLDTMDRCELSFQKSDKHTGGKWLVYDSEHRKGDQLQKKHFHLDFLEWECLNFD